MGQGPNTKVQPFPLGSFVGGRMRKKYLAGSGFSQVPTILTVGVANFLAMCELVQLEIGITLVGLVGTQPITLSKNCLVLQSNTWVVDDTCPPPPRTFQFHAFNIFQYFKLSYFF